MYFRRLWKFHVIVGKHQLAFLINIITNKAKIQIETTSVPETPTRYYTMLNRDLAAVVGQERVSDLDIYS